MSAYLVTGIIKEGLSTCCYFPALHWQPQPRYHTPRKSMENANMGMFITQQVARTGLCKTFLNEQILFVLFWSWWRYQKVLYLLFQARDKVTIVNKVWRQIIKAAVVGLGLHSPSTSRVSRCRGPTGGTTCGDAPPSSWTTTWRSAAVNEYSRSFTVPVERPGLLLVENAY